MNIDISAQESASASASDPAAAVAARAYARSPRRHRVLQIIPTLDRSGAEKQMCLLAAGLPAAEFDVQVCALTRGGPLQDTLARASVPVTVIGKRWRVEPHAWWRLRQHVRRVAPDLIQTWLFAANAYGRAAGWSCGVKHLLANERCVDPWKGWTELAVDRALARVTQRIVTNSSAVRDFYARHGLPADKLVVIPNGVDLPPPPPPATRLALLAEFGLPAGSRVIGLVARLWPQKRIKDAIWAADLLKVIRSDVQVLIFGDGPQRARLEKFRDQVLIRDRVHFVGARNDLAQWLPHFDLLWSTSAYEGQSNAILEALAAGVPVIATDIPGTRDLIAHEATGFLYPVGDRAMLARYTNRLLDQPETCQKLAAAGRRWVQDEFSVGRMVERYTALYREVLGG